MKSLIFILLLSAFTSAVVSQNTKPFKGTFYNEENNITLALDLYDTTLVAPNYAFLGKLNGYITGKLYDVWFVTSYHVKDGQATVSFSNDLGSDVQEVLFTLNKDSNLVYSAQGANVLRRAENRKWYKIPAQMVFVDKRTYKRKRK